MSDVFKMLKDLELKAVGLDEKTNKMQEGYFVSFRTIGLPIHFEDCGFKFQVQLFGRLPRIAFLAC